MAKRTFKLVALLLALAFALTGCSMIEVDKEMDDAEVIIKVNDVEMLKKDVMETYENYKASVEYQYQLYSAFGYAMTMPDDEEIKQMVIDGLVLQEVRRQKAAELGLDQLTDEELATVKENAQADYDSAYEQVKSSVTEDGMTDEEITAAADEYMTENGLTLEAYEESAREAFIDDKLDEYIYKDLTVTDDEIQAEFDSRVASDQESYEADSTAIDTKINNGSTVYYYPAGYRYVKHILINFLEDDSTAIDDLKTQISDIESEIDSFATPEPTTEPEVDPEATPEVTEAPTEAPTADPAATPVPTMDPTLPDQLDDLNAQLAAAYDTARANIQAKVDEAYQKALAGEDFDALIAEYGEDPGMESEPAKTYGYIVGENTTKYVASFKDAAMALANVGDISEPVESDYGMHIIKYVSEIPEGPAELTDYIKDSIKNELLTEKQEAEKAAREEEWKNEATIETNINEMVEYN